jgi:ATP-dependent DNA ligase
LVRNIEKNLLDINIGTVIEVKYTSLTPDGKMREPRLLRIREDK